MRIIVESNIDSKELLEEIEQTVGLFMRIYRSLNRGKNNIVLETRVTVDYK